MGGPNSSGIPSMTCGPVPDRAQNSVWKSCRCSNGCEAFASQVWRDYFPGEPLPPIWVHRIITMPQPESLGANTMNERWNEIVGDWQMCFLEIGPDQQPTARAWPGISQRQLDQLVGRPIDADRGSGFGDILLWPTSAPDQRPNRIAGQNQPVTALAFDPNGHYLASGGEDHAVVLWDVATRTRWAMLSGHTDRVLGIAWHPDGTTVYTGSADRTVIPWTVDPDTALTEICHQLAHDFTAQDTASCPRGDGSSEFERPVHGQVDP